MLPGISSSFAFSANSTKPLAPSKHSSGATVHFGMLLKSSRDTFSPFSIDEQLKLQNEVRHHLKTIQSLAPESFSKISANERMVVEPKIAHHFHSSDMTTEILKAKPSWLSPAYYVMRGVTRDRWAIQSKNWLLIYSPFKHQIEYIVLKGLDNRSTCLPLLPRGEDVGRLDAFFAAVFPIPIKDSW